MLRILILSKQGLITLVMFLASVSLELEMSMWSLRRHIIVGEDINMET